MMGKIGKKKTGPNSFIIFIDNIYIIDFASYDWS